MEHIDSCQPKGCCNQLSIVTNSNSLAKTCLMTSCVLKNCLKSPPICKSEYQLVVANISLQIYLLTTLLILFTYNCVCCYQHLVLESSKLLMTYASSQFQIINIIQITDSFSLLSMMNCKDYKIIFFFLSEGFLNEKLGNHM